MARQVTWAESALDGLEGIVGYIARDSPNYAAAFVIEMRDAARSLVHLGERGRVVPEWNDQSMRELLVENYRLIYKLSGATVSIIGVVHAARDLEALWKRERRSE